MNIAVVGCGGIGSFFAEHIDRLLELDQISHNFIFYDDDKVELKNILYQNFSSGDIDSFKTDALAMKFFNITFDTSRVTEKDLSYCNLVILCADNNKIRREAFSNYKTHNIPFIDSRANGRAIGIFSSSTENYLETIDSSDESSSCQNPFQIEKNEIEYGNVAIAALLAQVTLSYARSSKLPADIMLNI